MSGQNQAQGSLVRENCMDCQKEEGEQVLGRFCGKALTGRYVVLKSLLE